MKINLLIGCILAFGSTVAFGGGLFPAGAESKAVGMESALRAEGPPAVLYSPANLALVSDRDYAEPYLELGMVSVDYFYEHPEFDPVNIKVTSPTATAGFTHRLNDILTFSAIAFPTDSGETVIPGLPRKIGDSLMAIEIENASDVTEVGAGIGIKVFDGFALGVSGIRTFEKHYLKANMIGNDNPLVEIDYAAQFNRVVAGARFEMGNMFKASFAMHPEQIKRYEGIQGGAADSGSEPKIVNFQPATMMLGVGTQIAGVDLGVDVQQQKWSAGKEYVKDGVNVFEPDADLQDTMNIGLSGGYQFAKELLLTLGVSSINSPWGDGVASDDPDSQVHGVDFGNIEGIDRKVFAAGAKYKWKSFDFTTSAFYGSGSRFVAEEGANEGFYSVDVLSVSGGFRTSF